MPAEIAALPSPRVAVLLGGPNGDYRYTPPRVAHLVSALQSLGALGAGLMITPSRRTPADVVGFLREQTAWQPHLFWDGEGENPYAQFLAQADAFIVPADSVNMTGEPVRDGQADLRVRAGGRLGQVRPLPRCPAPARRHPPAAGPLRAAGDMEPIRRSNSGRGDRRRDGPPLGQAAADAAVGPADFIPV